MKIVVLGAGGQLGGAMSACAAGRHEVTALRRAEADITAPAALRRSLTDAAPDCIINCAAYAQVDEAEDEPEAAFAANALALRSLARIANDIGAVLVHYSTDFVFDGTETGPNREERAPSPSGIYATSKLVGEWFAADAARHYVLRVESLFGGATAKSTIDRLLDGIVAGRPVTAFSDRTVSPSYVVDVARATLSLVEQSVPCGVYHCVNSGATTWVALTQELARLAGRPDAHIATTRMADLQMRVRRPLNAALSNARLVAAGVPMPTWQDALARHVHSRIDAAQP